MKTGSWPATVSTHSHRDMEIVTYVLEGALAHRDSTGTSSVIRVGDVQRMSAGTGISHSEYNASQTELVHFLQIWILPEANGLEPGYEQRSFELDKNRGKWIHVIAPHGRDGAVTVHQDIEFLVAVLGPGQQLSHRLKPGRHGWLQLARGGASLNGMMLHAGDGAAISMEEVVEIKSLDHAEIGIYFALEYTEGSKSMFRIQKSADGNFVGFTLSGRIEAAGLLKLQKLLECEADDHSVVLNLREVKLVNRDILSFLATCETRGITLANCPAYIGEWIGKKHHRIKIK